MVSAFGGRPAEIPRTGIAGVTMETGDSHKNGYILIVEDDPGVMELEAQRLYPLGYPIAKASAPTDAIAMLARGTPELMLLDYSLPGMSALDLISGLERESVPVPPFLMVTGRGDEKVAVEVMKSGALDYIVKDARFLDNLLRTVNKALEKSALQKNLKKAEEELRKSARLYNFLAQVNGAVARERDAVRLLQEICRIAVEVGGMRMAWVGRPDPDLGRFVAVCSAGHVEGYLEGVKITLNGDTGKGPSGTSFRTGEISVCPDIATDPRMEPWREEALRREYRSSASIPLSIGEKVIFTLNLYSSEADFFVPEEMQLLSEIRGDISFALEALDSEQKRAAAQAALERTAAHLAHVMEANPVVIFKLRLAGGRFVQEWVSGNVHALIGYDPEEVLAPGWFEGVLHPEDLPLVVEGRHRLAAGETVVSDLRVRKKGNGHLWVHAQLKLVSPDEAIGSWTDISRLKESEVGFQELIDASPYGVVLRDGRNIAYINKRGLEIARAASAKEVVGHGILERIPERFHPELIRRMAGVDEGISAPPMEIEIEAMDGSLVPLEIHSHRIRYGGKETAVIFFRDLTEKKLADRMMREISDMQRVESLGQLAGGIAHDFNNMLTGIMANISLLERRCGGDPDTRDILKDTLVAAAEAKSLTANLLSFSKGGKPVKREICLEKVLREIFTLSTRGSSAATELEIDKELWSVDGDEPQLKQAVNNLLINALQAMPRGGTLRLSAANHGVELPPPALLPAGKYVKITVSDTGIGIPEEYLSHIFEPYFSTKKKGHGLGLSMAWSVVKNHGGHIAVASTPGKGSAFDIYLPATGRCLRAAQEKSAEIRRGTGRILVLEDEEIVTGAVRRMLRELGYECEIVQDGRAALRRYAEEKAAGRPFDAVIMDLTIPGGMGGKDAVAELRKSDPSARVIASSGYSDDAAMADYASNGFDAVLPKPYKFEELAAALQKLLAKRD